MNNNDVITFVGGGNMARSLIGGLLEDGRTPQTIQVSDTNKELLDTLQSRFGPINTTTDNSAAVAAADIVVLAVKPQVLQVVCEGIADAVQAKKPLIISVAAGIRAEDINHWLGNNCAIVRCMPNTPALIQTGASALYATPLVSESQKEAAESIMRAVGLSIWVKDEQQMNTVTALSGSGPAYFFLFMEALEEAATALGLEEKAARLLTMQTAFGAAKMALESADGCSELRRQVTSPGGTTEQALKAFEAGDLKGLVADAVEAAHYRSIELADELGTGNAGRKALKSLDNGADK